MVSCSDCGRVLFSEKQQAGQRAKSILSGSTGVYRYCQPYLMSRTCIGEDDALIIYED